MTPLFTAWAMRWGVPPQAQIELRDILLGMDRPQHAGEVDPELDGKSESHIQSLIRLEAADKGIRLWRNNVGAATTDSGMFIRFGLANDSAAVNKRLKSGDLIGVRPVVIRPEHVGHVIGQFVSRECKHGGWKYTGSEREVAQAHWATLINTMGGDATFASGKGTL